MGHFKPVRGGVPFRAWFGKSITEPLNR